MLAGIVEDSTGCRFTHYVPLMTLGRLLASLCVRGKDRLEGCPIWCIEIIGNALAIYRCLSLLILIHEYEFSQVGVRLRQMKRLVLSFVIATALIRLEYVLFGLIEVAGILGAAGRRPRLRNRHIAGLGSGFFLRFNDRVLGLRANWNRLPTCNFERGHRNAGLALDLAVWRTRLHHVLRLLARLWLFFVNHGKIPDQVLKVLACLIFISFANLSSHRMLLAHFKGATRATSNTSVGHRSERLRAKVVIRLAVLV